MSQISRLRNAEIANGNLINADDISAELNQLVTESNSQDSRITTLETGDLTFTGVKSYTDTVNINWRINMTNHANFARGVDVTGAIEGDVWYNTTDHLLKYYNGTSNKTLATLDDITHPYPTGYQASATPVWASNTTITLAYIQARSSDDTTNLIKTTATTLDVSGTGLNKLDNGVVANSTWYFVYEVSDGTSTGLMASTVNESVSGTISNVNFAYTTKRQLAFAFYVDASGHITPFRVGPGWPRSPKIMMDVDATASPWLVASGVNNTAFTTITLSILPDIAVSVDLAGYAIHNSLAGYGWGWIRPGGSSTNGRYIAYTGAPSNNELTNSITVNDLAISATKTIQYKTSGTNGPNMTFGITGFTVRVD